jgi:hypothetical protein
VQGDAQTSLRAYAGPASGPEAVNHPSLIHGTLRWSEDSRMTGISTF